MSTITFGSGSTQGYDFAICNMAATAAPTVNDDSGDGYDVGSKWYDTTNDALYVCVDATAAAAVWKIASLSTGGSVPSNAATAPALGILAHKTWSAAQAALGTATAVHAAVTDTGSTITITTALTNPTCARNITATPGGTTANVTAVQCIITGTDINNAALTETLPAFTGGAATAVTGSKAFKTVTSISQPACGTDVTISYGTGAKLGLEHKLTRNTVLYAFLADTKEGTAPTVAVSSSAVASNTVTLNSALNGTAVDLYYVVG